MSETLKVAIHGLHVTIVREFQTTLDDRKGVRNPVLLALVRFTLVHQITVKQNQGPFRFQGLILVFPQPRFDSWAVRTSSP